MNQKYKSIKITNMQIKTWDNRTIEFDLPEAINGNLVALPALIDGHVHFRTPGHEYKEGWLTGASAAIAGGVTTVLDMPNNKPAVIDEISLLNKRELIEKQLEEAEIPLQYGLYFGATNDNFEEAKKCKDKIVAIKLFMGSSTGDLLVADRETQAKWFELASELDLPIAVHAEDEEIIINEKSKILNPDVSDHSKLRPREAAIKATKQVIELARQYKTKLYILHLSTKEEVELVKTAKDEGIKVFAEVTPHHLFLNEVDYEQLGTKVQMNPPMRTKSDCDALWQGIEDGVIDTIGTDHAPHTLEEKNKPYGGSPSGIPGIETCLPLLLNTYNENKISLEKIVEITSTNPQKLFGLEQNKDWVIVDLDLEKEVKDENLKTKCGWSPFSGRLLKGWPVATVLNNKIFIHKL